MLVSLKAHAELLVSLKAHQELLVSIGVDDLSHKLSGSLNVFTFWWWVM